MNAFSIASDPSDPLTGNSISTTMYERKAFGPNAFIDVLPFDMLYTAETSPQVIVTVDDLPAICAKNNCAYDYSPSTNSITDFAYDGSVATMTKSQEFNTTMFTSFKLGTIDCPILVDTNDTIDCQLDESSLVSGVIVLKAMTTSGPLTVSYVDSS
jgi:hypothetical protein